MANYKDTLKAKIEAMQKVQEAVRAQSQEIKQGRLQTPPKQMV